MKKKKQRKKQLWPDYVLSRLECFDVNSFNIAVPHTSLRLNVARAVLHIAVAICRTNGGLNDDASMTTQKRSVSWLMSLMVAKSTVRRNHMISLIFHSLLSFVPFRSRQMAFAKFARWYRYGTASPVRPLPLIECNDLRYVRLMHMYVKVHRAHGSIRPKCDVAKTKNPEQKVTRVKNAASFPSS